MSQRFIGRNCSSKKSTQTRTRGGKSAEVYSEDPVRYRFNSMLSDSGVQLCERLGPDSEYRVIYDYDEQTVEILAFVSIKQDLERFLYRYLMFR